MLGIGDWVIKMIAGRLRGLGVSQLQDLIQHADDMETLQVIKHHLLKGDFKYQHVSYQKNELLQQLIDRAKEIEWQKHVVEAKKVFMETLDTGGLL